jgi:hypothetical protein
MEFSRYSSYPLSKMHVYYLGSREESMRRAEERAEQMTRAQKQFMGYGHCPVKERLASTTLPQFILREQGRGFGMNVWGISLTPGALVMLDSLPRPVPACGTVHCIGGSAQFLLKLKGHKDTVGGALGLDSDEAQALFYRWTPNHNEATRWPDSFAEAYDAANTPYKKAKVAAALVKLVAKTEGRCLHDGWKPKGPSK